MIYDATTFPDGPGLRFIDREQRWYGSGSCAICGDHGPQLVARAVRFWDCDDGWRMGVLCMPCMDDARARGPRDGDYAVAVKRDRAAQIDATADAGDLDGAYADSTD